MPGKAKKIKDVEIPMMIHISQCELIMGVIVNKLDSLWSESNNSLDEIKKYIDTLKLFDGQKLNNQPIHLAIVCNEERHKKALSKRMDKFLKV